MSAFLKKIQLWFYAYGWAGVIILYFSRRRERMSHDDGIVAKGRLRIHCHEDVPPHVFFQTGREFECRVRHASVAYAHDSIAQVRSASLKFANTEFKSPLDLEMNTGTRSLFWSARNFLEFVKHKFPRRGIYYWDYYDKYPQGLEASKDGLRRDPSSFSQLHYYSQCPLRFVGWDGVLRYARYRLVPEDPGAETGIIPPEELVHRWSEDEVTPGLAPDYLRREFADRLARGTVNYHLQIQLHTAVPGESEEVFNSNTPWDEATHPYLDVARVELDTLLSHEQSVRTWFSMENLPPSLGVLPAKSIDDYNSVNTLRKASDVARRARRLFARLKGTPPPRRPEIFTPVGSPAPLPASSRERTSTDRVPPLSRYMSAVWLLQGLALSVLGALMFFHPGLFPQLLLNCHVEEVRHDSTGPIKHYVILKTTSSGCMYDLNQEILPGRQPSVTELLFVNSTLQLMSPFVFTLALLSWWAFMREKSRVRWWLSLTFFVTGLAVIYVLSSYVLHAGSDTTRWGRVYDLLADDVPSQIRLLWTGCTRPSGNCADSFWSFTLPSRIKDMWPALCFFGCCAGLLVFVASNLLYWYLSPPSPRMLELSGAADTRPSGLWLVWLFQSVFFLALGIVLFVQKLSLPRWLLSSTSPGPEASPGSWAAPALTVHPALDMKFTHLQPLSPGLPDYVTASARFYDLQRFAAPLCLSMSLFSLMAVCSQRESRWDAYSRFFTLFSVLWSSAILIAWQWTFTWQYFLLLLPVLLLLAFNAYRWNASPVLLANGVDDDVNGWRVSDMLVGPLMLLRTLLTRRREHFNRGVAVRCLFKSRDDAPEAESESDRGLPTHDAFPLQQKSEALVRFSTDGRDDAGLAARGVALRLTLPNKATFELMMSTGSCSAVENLWEFMWLRLSRLGGRLSRWYLWTNHPRLREGMIASLRLAPDSYAQLRYHSQTVRFWAAQDGVLYLVRYRLIPASTDKGSPASQALESGRLQPWGDEPFPPRFRRAADERRPTDYLTQEMKRRLESEGQKQWTEGESSMVRMRLEAQFHPSTLSSDATWYNPAVDWSTDAHPWHPLGELHLRAVLSDEDTEKLVFNPANVPPSLGVPASPSIFDPRSLADAEKRVHLRVHRTRVWATQLFGLPSLNTSHNDPT